jgi:hypothetical protein
MKYIIILVDILYCEAQHSPTAMEIILVSSHEWSGSGSACFEAVHCEYLILRLFLALPLLLMYITAHPLVLNWGKNHPKTSSIVTLERK